MYVKNVTNVLFVIAIPPAQKSTLTFIPKLAEDSQSVAYYDGSSECEYNLRKLLVDMSNYNLKAIIEYEK